MNKILYIGSGEDLTPVYKFPNSKFVYVDSKPRSPYGYPYYYKDDYDQLFKEKIINKLKNIGLTTISKPLIFTDNFKEISVPDLDSHMVDFGKLKYYFSTSIPHESFDLFKENILKSMCDSDPNKLPDTLFISSHYPHKDSLELLKKPFHFIGSYPTYFPKDIQEAEEDDYIKGTCIRNIVSNKNNIVSKYMYIDKKGNLHICANYKDFYENYIRDI